MTVVTKGGLLADQIGEGGRARCNFCLLVKSCILIMGSREEVTVLNNVRSFFGWERNILGMRRKTQKLFHICLPFTFSSLSCFPLPSLTIGVP